MNKTGLLSTNKIYIDGISMGNLTAVVGTDRTIPGFNTNLRLASVNNGGYNCNIKYGNVMVYNRELTQSEIKQNYYAGLQRFIPTDGLVLSLDAQNTNLYATSPTTAYDISGNANNGTLINGTLVSSIGNSSWSFDGVNDRIIINSTSSLNPETITLQAWVNLKILETSVYPVVISKSGTLGSGQYGLWLWRGGLSQNGVGFRINKTDASITTISTYIDNNTIINEWILLTGTFDGQTMKIYYNDEEKSSLSIGLYSIATTDDDLIIGDDGQNRFFNGFINSVSIYNRALSQNEVSTIYNATKTRYGL